MKTVLTWFQNVLAQLDWGGGNKEGVMPTMLGTTGELCWLNWMVGGGNKESVMTHHVGYNKGAVLAQLDGGGGQQGGCDDSSGGCSCK